MPNPSIPPARKDGESPRDRAWTREEIAKRLAPPPATTNLTPVAEIIIEDSVRYAFENGSGLDDVNEALTILRSPQGNELAGEMIFKYHLDPRVLRLQPGIALSISTLRPALEQRLAAFVDADSSTRDEYLAAHRIKVA